MYIFYAHFYFRNQISKFYGVIGHSFTMQNDVVEWLTFYAFLFLLFSKYIGEIGADVFNTILLKLTPPTKPTLTLNDSLSLTQTHFPHHSQSNTKFSLTNENRRKTPLFSKKNHRLGKPGVDSHVRHEGESACAVTNIVFLVNEGALVSATADDSLHLWNFRQQKIPLIAQSLKFQRER